MTAPSLILPCFNEATEVLVAEDVLSIRRDVGAGGHSPGQAYAQ
jgi:hypothetical protein